MDIQKEMEQYEAVLKEAGYGHRSLSKSSLGYLNPITQFGFEVWFNAQKQAVPEGFILVPKEPTQAMLDSARDWSTKKYGKAVGNDGASGCYKAMIETKEQNQ